MNHARKPTPLRRVRSVLSAAASLLIFASARSADAQQIAAPPSNAPVTETSEVPPFTIDMAPPAPVKPPRAWPVQNTLYGSTGLLRLADAGVERPGGVRLGAVMEWFSVKGFLCTGNRPCPSSNQDKARHLGWSMTLSIATTSWLELFGAIRAASNTNDTGKPKSLSTPGDVVLGVKIATPLHKRQWLRGGFETQVLLYEGTDAGKIETSATSLRMRALGTLDIWSGTRGRVPLRLIGNLGYRLDNTRKIVEQTESDRGGYPITRIERFGLGVNKVDFVEAGIGLEAAVARVHPFVSYTVEVPVARGGYDCKPSGAVTVAYHDSCLGDQKVMLSRLSYGARFFPKGRVIVPFVAFDVGLTGTRRFVEEVSPMPPWMLFVGIGN